MSTPLLTTKLYIPPLRPNVTLRPRLVEQLQAGLHRKLTLIAAPAGFGKTTLLSAWAAVCDRPVAWLSLDDGDSDPTRFFLYVVAALQTVAPTVGAGVVRALQSPQPPPIDAVLTTLLNDIAALRDPFMLVLDDYHAIDAHPVDQALAFLIEHLPPRLHVVIATREDSPLPLAGFRARGQLTELRATDLRFTPAETADFLNHVMGLRLATDDIAALEARTEGWIAGLQLAALSMHGRTDTARFIQAFTGSHRFVLDYLVEEVLQQQPAHIQQFLLHTAILDRLCGPLCDAVLDDPAGTGQAVLHAIERANLFLVPLDGERHWYRYHHLFGEFLRQRLVQDVNLVEGDLAVLHGRASGWYEAQGLDLEALHHAAAAADHARLARLAELSWERMDSSFQTVAWRRWVQHLPEAVVRARPVLCTQYAWALMDAGEMEASEARLCDAERALDSGSMPNDGAELAVVVAREQLGSLRVRIAVARAYMALARGDAVATVRYAALAYTADAEPLLRAQAEVLVGFARLASGELEQARRAIAGWIEHTQQTGNLAFALASASYLAEICVAQGQLREAARLYRQFLQLVPADDEAMRQAAPHLHLGLALLAHEQGDEPTAALHLQASKERGERASLSDWPFRWSLAQARVQESAGAWEAALNLLDAAKRLYVRNPVPDVRPVAAIKARVSIRQGVLTSAMAWAAERGLSAADDLTYMREFEHMTFARLLIARYRQEHADSLLHDALGLLGRLLVAAEAGGRLGSVLDILLLQALAHEAGGDLQQALVPLARALALAEPEGYVRVFVDEGPPLARLVRRMQQDKGKSSGYLNTLLAAFGTQPDPLPASSSSSPSEEPLSEREREVLRLIAEGLSNQELAARLYLSPHTIKVHTRNIYGKLGVTSRTQALARARTLGILDLT